MEKSEDKSKKANPLPDSAAVESELKRIRYHRRFRSTLGSTVSILITVAAAALLVASLWMPVFRVFGNSMEPGISNKAIVVAVKTSKHDRGDVIAFYHNNSVLFRRIIALPGDIVDMDENGIITVNGTALDEPYVEEHATGEVDVIFPYEVPEARYFVLGDNRIDAVDSRCTAVGCIAEEMIIGRLLLTVWPAAESGFIR